MACRCGDTCVMVPTCDEEQDFDCDHGSHDLGPLMGEEGDQWRRCHHCGAIVDEDDRWEDDWDADQTRPTPPGPSTPEPEETPA